MISFILLTYNSSKSIERTLRPLSSLSDDIHVVDSFSTDDTIALCQNRNCRTIQRRFLNYSNQRNWAIENLSLRYSWQMHVDADEELEDELVRVIGKLDLQATPLDGYMVGRKVVFMGRVLRHGSIAVTWHNRLFKTGYGRCENRLYDQHFVCKGRVGVLNAFMLDHQEDRLSEWTSRHNRWSDLEAEEVATARATGEDERVLAKQDGNAIEQRRYYKARYYMAPLFLRATAYFFYRYVICMGFLDGKEGLIYHVLQGFWFRFLVDAKIYELRRDKLLGREARRS
jgi:glycosyltransferase involved in cell wall biosynthesis